MWFVLVIILGYLYILQPIRISDLRKVDPLKACEYFNKCFKDPSTFSIVIVGNIDPSIALPLILQYLVSKTSFRVYLHLDYIICPHRYVIYHAGWNTKPP